MRGAVMAKSVFYSFEYQPDNWRVQQVINMGAVSGGDVHCTGLGIGQAEHGQRH